MINKILSDYTDTAVERHDGRSNKICPLCDKIVFEADMEEYYEETSDRQLECCTECREDFEFDNNITLDADVLETDIFNLLWKYALELIKENRKVNDGKRP